MKIIIFGIYLFVLLVIFVFIVIVTLHIGDMKQYSKYLSLVLRIYLVTIVLISIFGGYMILTDKNPPEKRNQAPVQKIVL